MRRVSCIRLSTLACCVSVSLFSFAGAYASEAKAPPPASDDESSSGSSLHQTFTHEAMWTDFEFTVYAPKGLIDPAELERIAEEAFAEVDRLEARVSNWRSDSQLSYVNNHAATEPVRVAPDVFELLMFAQRLHRTSGGAFDLSVGPLIDAWGFYRNEGRLPNAEELRSALAGVGFDKVRLDAKERTVSFRHPGLRLDVGGIAKGLALDQAAEVLRSHGIGAAVLHAGTSSVLAIGAPPGKPGWTVRIRNPYNEQVWLDEVELRDSSLSTSGSYERFFELEGKKYCHIFDPSSGKPVEGMLSASAIARTGLESDALSTAFFVMGKDKTAAYCRAHPEVRAILVPEPADGNPKPVRINFPQAEE